MFRNIQSLLERFTFEPPEGTRKRAIIAAVSEVLGITIQAKQIRIQGSYAFIEARPIVRSELMLHKADILRKLRNTFGEASRNPVIDIR
jgi:hypothetical protein